MTQASTGSCALQAVAKHLIFFRLAPALLIFRELLKIPGQVNIKQALQMAHEGSMRALPNLLKAFASALHRILFCNTVHKYEVHPKHIMRHSLHKLIRIISLLFWQVLPR